MKKLFTLIIFCTLSYFSNAQQNFTSLYIPTVGSTTPFKYISSNSLSAGSAGNQTWDFSGLTFSSYPSIPNETYTTGSGSANIGISNLGLGYYTISSTSKTFYGTYTSASSYTTFTDAAQILTLPMAYNGTTTDAFSGNGSVSVGPNAGTTVISNGSATTVYDGYGTLITNNGTFTDVVRIKTSMTYTITYNATSATSTQSNVIYDWYSRSSGKLLYSLQESTSTSSSGTVSSKLALSYDHSSATTSVFSAIKPEASFTVYPNPTTDKIILQAGKMEAGNYTVKIINEKGSVEQTRFVSVAGNDIEIETSSLATGKYSINLSSSTSNETIRFIKY